MLSCQARLFSSPVDEEKILYEFLRGALRRRKQAPRAVTAAALQPY
jgi:hypothetical protein